MVLDLLAFLELVVHGVVGCASAVVSCYGRGCSEGLGGSDEWFEVSLQLERTHGVGGGGGFYLPRVLLSEYYIVASPPPPPNVTER